MGNNKTINRYYNWVGSGWTVQDRRVGLVGVHRRMGWDNNIGQSERMGNRAIDSLVLRSESLMTKIMIGKEDEIIEHIESEKIECEQSLNQMGDTIGHYAAYRGLFKVLGYLIHRGDTFDVRNNRGLTAIDVALPTVREWLYRKRKRSHEETPLEEKDQGRREWAG